MEVCVGWVMCLLVWLSGLRKEPSVYGYHNNMHFNSKHWINANEQRLTHQHFNAFIYQFIE